MFFRSEPIKAWPRNLLEGDAKTCVFTSSPAVFMELICDRSCAPECKSGIQGLAIIRLKTGSDICGCMGGVISVC